MVGNEKAGRHHEAQPPHPPPPELQQFCFHSKSRWQSWGKKLSGVFRLRDKTCLLFNEEGSDLDHKFYIKPALCHISETNNPNSQMDGTNTHHLLHLRIISVCLYLCLQIRLKLNLVY